MILRALLLRSALLAAVPRTSGRLAAAAIATAVAVLAAGIADEASAQYQWLDDHGRMVYSDRAPPTSVPPARILRAPEVRPVEPPKPAGDTVAGRGGQPAKPGAPGVRAATGGALASAAPAAPVSAADREMAYRKRLAEQAEAEKKAAAENARKVALARACEDARGNVRLLESGQRVTRINASGEREFLSDRERDERLATARRNLGQNC